jgi:hypothetical protein
MRMRFFLYFPQEKAARKASAPLGRREYEVEVREPENDIRDWAVPCATLPLEGVVNRKGERDCASRAKQHGTRGW